MVRPSRLAIIHGALLAFAVMLLLRAAQVQLLEGSAWAARGERQHVAATTIPAPRGDIRDARGVVLAGNRELVRLHVAPREVRDRQELRRALSRLGVPRSWIERSLDRRRRWVSLPGRYLPQDVASPMGIGGVYREPVIDRVYAPSAGLSRLVGRVGPDGEGTEGLEFSLDSLLRGTPGRSTSVRDGGGRALESPRVTGVAARAGHAVTLTINYELQEIADRALADAVAHMRADGGDILVLDPHDGAILAMASRRQGRRVTAATALTEPFEPGSTLKPFIAAALLSLGRARPNERIDTYRGRYQLHGRTITDLHKDSVATMGDVIRWSSNVGIVRLSERLTQREQYEALRDFGFGMPTLLPYPAEAGGTLREPARWSRQSAASLAMGYEIAVTPVQLAAAYASIANGGELVQPMLVREIRGPDGKVTFRARRRVVRRVMETSVAEAVREMLVDVVARGTAMEADLSTFHVGGKTGTARRATAGTGYVRGEYYATFVGLFPAERPQYVVLTKLDNPGGMYGGRTAAPVSKIVLEAALAARDAALDRGALAERSSSFRANGELAGTSRARRPDTPPTSAVRIDLAAPRTEPQASPPRPVPDTRGMPLREAVRTLHGAGFRVRMVSGSGSTAPAAGTLAAPGALVRLPRGH